MKITKPTTSEIKQLIKVYKEAFPVHGIFQKSDEEVFAYLESVENDLLVAIDDNKVVGGLLIKSKEASPEHKIIRFAHVAVEKNNQHHGVGSELLKEAEKIAGKGKVEIHVSENEKVTLEFYKKNGYEVEGELKSHYRMGEICYVLGKVI